MKMVEFIHLLYNDVTLEKRKYVNYNKKNIKNKYSHTL